MKKRNKILCLYLTEEEHQQLKENRGNEPLAKWIRETALSKRSSKQVHVIDPALLYELNKIGTNINQIARVANIQKYSFDLVKASYHLEGMHRALSEILEEVKKNAC